jgi:hypothetical protein
MEGGTRPDILTTDYRTIILMPWGEDVRKYTFTVMATPPIKTGRTKIFPGHATLGPTDPDRDDTLTTLNIMDVSGGQGVYTINPASDLNNYWWGIASAEGTDGWTAAREPIMNQPAIYEVGGNCVPLGRVGQSMYALWGKGIHKWNPDAQSWSNALLVLPAILANTEGMAMFGDAMYLPLGSYGYAILSETAPGTPALTPVAGATSPTFDEAKADPGPTSNPRAFMFASMNDGLWCITTKAEGYKLVASITGASNDWKWHQTADTARAKIISLDLGFEPKAMAVFPNAQSQYNLWVSGRRGLRTFDSGQSTWAPTALSNPPPHPDFGRCMQEFRPGEALWIAGGGGDLVQYTIGGGTVPASGPGGAREGLPAGRRGSIVSMATDLFHLYAYVQGEVAFGASASLVEESPGSDPMYVPLPAATSSVIASTGKGWHPLWETATPGTVPTKIVVADSVKASSAVDYRTFWGLGAECWSVANRLSTHSSRQAVQTGTGERFRSSFSRAGYTESFLEWGRFNAGSIANNKLASHVAIVMEHATAPVPGVPNTGEYVEYEYYTDRDHEQVGVGPPWHNLGRAERDSALDTGETEADPRTILPFGLFYDGETPVFSQGESFRWIRQRLRFISNNPIYPPICTALTLAYLPLPQDAATKAYSVVLPVERDRVTGMTAEVIIKRLEGLLSPPRGQEKFLLLQDGQEKFRAYISSISYGRAPTPDGPGALNLTVIQIPSGVPKLVGEPFPEAVVPS